MSSLRRELRHHNGRTPKCKLEVAKCRVSSKWWRQGYDVVVGNRFRGEIKPGAMPRHHKYLGNPVLTSVRSLFWPSAMVDPILRLLYTLHLVSDETESDGHQKRIPVETLQQMLERIGFQRFVHRPFEFGVNNLMVASH
jgi:hypothetical protein